MSCLIVQLIRTQNPFAKVIREDIQPSSLSINTNPSGRLQESGDFFLLFSIKSMETMFPAVAEQRKTPGLALSGRNRGFKRI